MCQTRMQDQFDMPHRSQSGAIHCDPIVSRIVPSKKVSNIQSLRAIAALLVVFYHLTFIEAKYGNGIHVLPAWFKYGSCGVDLFFVISGLVMVTITQGKFHSITYACNFLYQRGSRIYPLYWFYSLAVLGVFLVRPSMVNEFQGNQVHLVTSFLLLPDRILPLLSVGWSLVFECYFYLVFSAFLILKSKQLPLALVLWSIVIAIGQAVSNGLQVTYGPTLAIMTHPMTCEFIVGCLIGVLIHNNRMRFSTIAIICGVMVFVAECCLWNASTELDFEDGWQRVVFFGVPAALIVYGAVSAEIAHGWVLSRWMERIGDTSYSIYLSHLLVLSALGRIWWGSELHGPMQSRLVMALMVALAIGVGFISYYLIELPLIKLVRKWRPASVSWRQA